MDHCDLQSIGTQNSIFFNFFQFYFIFRQSIGNRLKRIDTTFGAYQWILLCFFPIFCQLCLINFTLYCVAWQTVEYIVCITHHGIPKTQIPFPFCNPNLAWVVFSEWTGPLQRMWNSSGRFLVCHAPKFILICLQCSKRLFSIKCIRTPSIYPIV